VSIKIYRRNPRLGGPETPWKDSRGYQLADPNLGADWHHVKNAIFTQSLDKAAELIKQDGFAIRMGRKGVRPSLIRHCGLQITH
jgi:hypothetical protein